ncbi:high-potential iron-sulfur protein [Tepidicella baoligensis]|uniref:high-potential iron-sulfur protein n=1 Tax=Tepidicella baoligensis TaxID=2707016 RepID=UPI0015DBBE99|nr:high-potential iron-sulfur protein [Tepidicella baoligensis]
MTMQRRVFMMNVAATSCAMALASVAKAAGMPMVAETDPMAVNLNYKADATQVKHAKYKEGQQCSNCVLYQGKATDAAAACGIFPGKQVAGKGWCTAYAKKA